MPRARLLLSACLAIGAASLAGCGKGSQQADALDKAALQSDPAAAAELHNQADDIRDGGSNADMAAPGSPAQQALQAAGNAAAANPEPASRPARQPVDRETGLAR